MKLNVVVVSVVAAVLFSLAGCCNPSSPADPGVVTYKSVSDIPLASFDSPDVSFETYSNDGRVKMFSYSSASYDLHGRIWVAENLPPNVFVVETSVSVGGVHVCAGKVVRSYGSGEVSYSHDSCYVPVYFRVDGNGTAYCVVWTGVYDGGLHYSCADTDNMIWLASKVSDWRPYGDL